jgi:hypothetical protein
LECNSSDFDTIQDKFGYISYKFKSKQSFIDGYFCGLSVSLNLTNIPFIRFVYDYVTENGLKLMIHNDSIDPGYYTGLSKKGISIAPGFINEIKIKRTFTHKLGKPFNECIKDLKTIDSYDSDLFRYT